MGHVVYYGVSNEFDIVEEACITPEYEVKIGENEDLSMGLCFVKIVE